MMFGGATDEIASRAIVDHAREAGINFIDTGRRLQRRPLRGDHGARHCGQPARLGLGDEGRQPDGSGPNRAGLSRKWVIQACEDSLRRLGTDFIDIYYLHKEDHATPLDERSGRSVISCSRARSGISACLELRLLAGRRDLRLCDELGIDRPVVSQPYYNAMNRMPEVEHLPACGYYGLGVAS